MREAMRVEHDETVATPETPTPEASDALSVQLAAWRMQGVDKRDPARFHRIEALALRSRAYTGDVRRVLDERLKTLVDEFVQSHGDAPMAPSDESRQTSQPASSPLAVLTADIAQRVGAGERPAPAKAPDRGRVATPASQTQPTREAAQPGSVSSAPQKRPVVSPSPTTVPVTPTVISTDDAFEDLDVLEYFRETWSKLSTNGNLRQSLAQVPENAGPLNSSHLVHRALSLMHDVSPDYLRHFLRHADALSWLEDMETTGVLGNKPAARAATVAKPSRAKTR
ncbi:hypothetical protein PHO31112_01905 [Pandoraea horticolens]|uniref:DUF2894 domain-containing protein n=1 Tax=Pandoraea horticolens TaxID=2508298 RepID=A0A5E4U9F0_9BURK|nr:DUF2894 domain-containing protein [Pandoraea horticolens]VVD96625.1 hypothetical protein PHO31112_01905 [Pandoraea horticolens]